MTVSIGMGGAAAFACWKACIARRWSPHSMHVASHALSATVSTHPLEHIRSHIAAASEICCRIP